MANKTRKTLISIRVTSPTHEQINRLAIIRDENQAEVISRAVADLYEKETARIERQVTDMITQYAADLPAGETQSLTLTIKTNDKDEQVFTLSKDASETGWLYLREVTSDGKIQKITPAGK